ncbi:MAG: selenate reductase, partial [Oscillibacter sp.]|nr:selenate reductase [Oscillibacter sp.]
HLDALCNECGNCEAFCPYSSAPSRDKLTLYPDADALRAGPQNGFFPLGTHWVLLRLDGAVREVDLDRPNDLPPDLALFILTVLDRYDYLLP